MQSLLTQPACNAALKCKLPDVNFQMGQKEQTGKEPRKEVKTSLRQDHNPDVWHNALPTLSLEGSDNQRSMDIPQHGQVPQAHQQAHQWYCPALCHCLRCQQELLGWLPRQMTPRWLQAQQTPRHQPTL